MIDILMATYNGAAFLDTQIASIVNQSEKNWKLIIHDDGSKDNTVAIIKRWMSIDKRIVLIDDGVTYKNSGKNFLSLLQHSSGDLVCFSDQDDYWLDNKLEKMKNSFPCNIKEPHLLTSSCYLWNMENSEISFDFIHAYPDKLSQIIFMNGGLQGCSMMFNSQLRDKILKYSDCSKYFMHDLLVTFAAFCLGSVSYIKEGLFLYRHHENTVTVHPPKNFRDYVIKALNHSNAPVVTKQAYDDITQFYSDYIVVLDEKNKKMLDKYLAYPKKNFLFRLFSILFSDFAIGYNGHFKLIIKLLIRSYIK